MVFFEAKPVNLKTHDVYPEIMINEKGTAAIARLIKRDGTVAEIFELPCKNRKDGTKKATKKLNSVAKKYIKGAI
ncbi:MAG: hypothetical protein V3T88_02405 [Nitrosomonadaceae bacterium]